MFFLLFHTLSTVDIRSHSFMARSQNITISIVSSLALHLVIDFPFVFPNHSSYRLTFKKMLSCFHFLFAHSARLWFPKICTNVAHVNFTFRILAISSASQCFIYSFFPNSLPFQNLNFFIVAIFFSASLLINPPILIFSSFQGWGQVQYLYLVLVLKYIFIST